LDFDTWLAIGLATLVLVLLEGTAREVLRIQQDEKNARLELKSEHQGDTEKFRTERDGLLAEIDKLKKAPEENLAYAKRLLSDAAERGIQLLPNSLTDTVAMIHSARKWRTETATLVVSVAGTAAAGRFQRSAGDPPQRGLGGGDPSTERSWWEEYLPLYAKWLNETAGSLQTSDLDRDFIAPRRAS